MLTGETSNTVMTLAFGGLAVIAGDAAGAVVVARRRERRARALERR